MRFTLRYLDERSIELRRLVLDCATETHAFSRAMKLRGAEAMELWRGRQLLWRIKPRQSSLGEASLFRRPSFLAVVASVVVALAATGAAAGPPPGKGKSHGKGGGAGTATAEVRFTFSEGDRIAVRDYYGTAFEGGRCPPGLAKKNNGCMPPGQAKKWAMGRPLAPDVVFHDLPDALRLRLSLPPVGYRYVRVAGDILLIAAGTGMVAAAIEDLARN